MTENRTETKSQNRKEFNMNKNRGFHVTVVDNKTGETVGDFDTRAIVCVVLDEIDEAKAKEDYGADMSCEISSCQYIGCVSYNEMLGIKSALQDLIQDIEEEHPVLELIARLCTQRTIHLGEDD